MISSFRNFAKTKFAGLLVFIMIIPFVFWGMGSMFSSGNSNNIAKINQTNISTKDFIEHVNKSNIPQQTLRDNLDKNIVEELLSTLISTTLIDLEVKNFDILISEETLSKKIKFNKNFHNENGNFERMKYEKFLLENNQSAPAFELRLRGRELQKNLFDYIGAGTTSPNFLTKKLFKEENNKLELEFVNLNSFYRKKDSFNDLEITEFIEDNKDQLKVDYIDFDYGIINPKKLIGVDDFNQAFFDKIDEIEIKISNNLDLKEILTNYGITTTNVSNFRFSPSSKKIEKKIFEVRNIEFDIIEYENNYIVYKINKTETRTPDLNDEELKKEVLELVFQKSKFDYNSKLLKKINEKQFNNNDFQEFGKDKIQSLLLNSVKDNKKFEINSVQILYSLPANSFTLINDEKDKIYLAQVKNYSDVDLDKKSENYKSFINKENTRIRNTILKSYDFFLNDKYNVDINKVAINNVENYFK